MSRVVGIGRGGGRPLTAAAWVLALAVVSVGLLIGHRSEPVRAIRDGLAAVLEPARAAVASVATGIGDVVAAVGDIGALRAENDALRERLAAAEQRVATLEEAGRENAELRALLGVAQALDMDLVPTVVVGRDASNLASEVTIGAGTDAGLRAGMPVVAAADGEAAALVGTVVEVRADTARVRLVGDPRSVVVGRDQRTGALGAVRGGDGGQLTLANVPASEVVEIGDAVLTAGLVVEDDASRYPGGLLLGRVIAVGLDENGVTQTAWLEPAIEPDEIARVLVVTAFDEG